MCLHNIIHLFVKSEDKKWIGNSRFIRSLDFHKIDPKKKWWKLIHSHSLGALCAVRLSAHHHRYGLAQVPTLGVRSVKMELCVSFINFQKCCHLLSMNFHWFFFYLVLLYTFSQTVFLVQPISILQPWQPGVQSLWCHASCGLLLVIMIDWLCGWQLSSLTH